MKRSYILGLLLLVLGLAGILLYQVYGGQSATLPPPNTDRVATETPVTTIDLSGPVSAARAEISGMAWYGDWLVLLPQYPNRVDDSLYALKRQDILDYLDGGTLEPLSPTAIPVDAPGLNNLRGFEGFEAIVFDGNAAYATIEAKVSTGMQSYLLAGTIAPDLGSINFDAANFVTIPAAAALTNYSDETLLLTNDRLLTIYEANGQNVNPNPQAQQISRTLERLEPISFPNIEYRVTDATSVDASGRFWVINYLFGGSLDKLDPAPDPLVEQYGIGPTHAANRDTVERLVELQYSENSITRTDTPPIPLQLADADDSRNWEGLTRLEGRGFLLVTDKFPGTQLAFVPTP